MVKLITNSDDFGLTSSITDAIIDCHLNGIMTSTTIMANMDGTDYAIKKAKEIPTLGVGIHFNLTEGKPLSELYKIPDLVDENGSFKKNSEQRVNLIFGKHKQKQVEIELENQLAYLLDNGLIPTHFDSHHHITGTPIAFEASIRIAKKYKINKARNTNIDFWYKYDFTEYLIKLKHTILTFPKALLHKRNSFILKKNNFRIPDYKILPSRVYPLKDNYIFQFINTLSVLKSGVTEISFHPGYKDSYSFDSIMMSEIRRRDLEVAKSDIVRNYIESNGIQLIDFRDL